MANIKALREARGWSLERLNWESGVAIDTILRLENGEPLTAGKQGRAAIFRKLARALGVTEEEISDIAKASNTTKDRQKKAIAVLCIFFMSSIAHATEKNPWSAADITAIARTLAGECFDDKEQDKRRVCEVILNRVSSGRFGNTILSVAAAPNQFHGYWKQSRPISENDYKVARETLQDWHNNGCKALSHYLYFRAGANRENQFR